MKLDREAFKKQHCSIDSIEEKCNNIKRNKNGIP